MKRVQRGGCPNVQSSAALLQNAWAHTRKTGLVLRFAHTPPHILIIHATMMTALRQTEDDDDDDIASTASVAGIRQTEKYATNGN